MLEALNECTSETVQVLCNALSVNAVKKDTSTTYHAKRKGQRDLTSNNLHLLLCKVMKSNFLDLYSCSDYRLVEIFVSENFETVEAHFDHNVYSLIFAILHGRGYPDGIIQSLTSALLCFANKHQLQPLPPDSKKRTSAF